MINSMKFIERWEQLYNESCDQMADECYAEDAVAMAMGSAHKIVGREAMRQAANAVLAAAPRRKMRVDHIHPCGETIVVEAVLLDPDRGDDWESPFCAVLTLRDGMIVSDHTYLDFTQWPGL